MFDDNAFSDIANREIVKHNENTRAKIVSKRSVNSSNEKELGWWDRVKRSIKNLFGYENEVEHVEENKLEQQDESKKSLSQETQSVLASMSLNESEMMRRKREHFDDEEDDDEDNEINGSGDHDERRENEERNWDNTTPSSENDVVEVNTPFPDIPDTKYCE